MRVIMLFLDGVGIGRKDPAVNPLFAAKLPSLRSILGDELPALGQRKILTDESTLIPLDANLGVEGLPQSGTGQTALFTGENGAAIIGRHFGPYPYSTLRPIIAERNIFRRLRDAGKKVCFANAFPHRFFEYVEKRPTRTTVTTYACMQSGIPLLREEDLQHGRAVSADLTGEGWHALGHPEVRVIEPAEAGRRLARLLSDFDFVLFEYWKTDHAGHTASIREAVRVLEDFDALLGGLLEILDVETDLLLITSDHGNLEDCSIKTHTRHPVPAIFHGFRHREVALRTAHHSHPGDLTRVTPALIHSIQRTA